jgi:fimbrial isopeptide formation D2 family protein
MYAGALITNNILNSPALSVEGCVYNNGGTFNMEGGRIADNTGPQVYNLANSTFLMSGGIVEHSVGSGTDHQLRGVFNAGDFEMSGDSIIRNNAINVANLGTFEMRNGTITGATSSGINNGAIFRMYGGIITLNSVTAPSVGAGGGVDNHGENAIFDMYGGTISFNTATGISVTGGGGVHNAALFNMYGGEIINNSATACFLGGGGVLSAGPFNMYGGLIADNIAAREGGFQPMAGGGGILINGNATTITGGVISNNSADGVSLGGGGILVYVGDCEITDFVVSDNTTTIYGGGIYVRLEGTLTVTDSVISGNTAYDGGGIYNLGTTYINSSLITGNTASHDGGGIYTSRARLPYLFVDADSSFSFNRARAAYNRHPLDTFANTTYATNILLGEGPGKWTFPLLQGYNNYDIAFQGDPPQPLLYIVTYDGNGNDGGDVPEDTTLHVPGTAVTVLGNIGNNGSGPLTKIGSIFLGWAYSPTATTPDFAVSGSSVMPPTFVITGPTTLYAVWRAGVTVTVNKAATPDTFSANGDTVSYTISFTMPADVSGLEHVRIEDALPAGLALASTSAVLSINGVPQTVTLDTSVPGAVSYTIAGTTLTASAGQAVTLTVNCVVSGWAGGSITNTANVYVKPTGEPEELSGSGSETINFLIPSVLLNKTAAPGTIVAVE